MFQLEKVAEEYFYSSLLVSLLDFLLKGSLRGYSFVSICEKIGNFLLENVKEKTEGNVQPFFERENENLSDLIRYSGSFSIQIINSVFNGKLKFSRLAVDEGLFEVEDTTDLGLSESDENSGSSMGCPLDLFFISG